MFFLFKSLRSSICWSANFFLLAILLSQGCKKKEALGTDLLPDGVNGIRTLNLTGAFSFSREGSFFRSDEDTMSTNFLGAYHDPFCGILESGFMVQYALPFPNDIPVNALTSDSLLGIDSVVVQLPYIGYYGNSNEKNIRVRVFELNTKLSKSSVYYSNFVPDNFALGNPLADLFITPNTTDNVNGVFDTVPMLKLRLNNTLGKKIMGTGSNLQSNELFQDWFKGLLFVCEGSTMAPNKGGIAKINLFSTASRLIVFGKHKRIGSVRLVFNTGSDHAKANYTRYIRKASTEVESQFSDTSVGNIRFGIMGLNALRGKLYLKQLNLLSDSMPAFIHKAELIIPVDKNRIDYFGWAPRLSLQYTGSDNRTVPVPDDAQSGSFNTGGFLASDFTYRFNITRYVQERLIGGLSDKGLSLSCYLGHQSPDRTVLLGGDNIILKITYKRIR